MQEPNATEPIFQRAVKTFELAEIEKRRLARDFIAKSTLEGYQRKMFLDDYNYAALVYGQSAASAGQAYSNLVNRITTMSDEDLQREVASPTEPVSDRAGAAKMQQFYAVALSSPNPDYANVLKTLRSVVPNDDPTTSDLFKDALTYVAAKTDIAKMVAADEEANEKTKSWIESTPDPQARAKALAQFELTHERPKEAVQPTTEALDRLFADRFARHGLDGDNIIASLNSLSLSNVAQEIWIQAP